MERKGLITNLFVARRKRAPMQPVNQLEVTVDGIIGDRSFGRENRQVLIMDVELLEKHDLIPGVVRENVDVKGLMIHDLPKGTHLVVGTAEAVIVGPCTPCDRLEEVRSGLKEELRGERGIFIRILKEGTISIGDEMKVLEE